MSIRSCRLFESSLRLQDLVAESPDCFGLEDGFSLGERLALRDWVLGERLHFTDELLELLLSRLVFSELLVNSSGRKVHRDSEGSEG